MAPPSPSGARESYFSSLRRIQSMEDIQSMVLGNGYLAAMPVCAREDLPGIVRGFLDGLIQQYMPIPQGQQGLFFFPYWH